jgi:hypothetical protein
MVSSRWRVAVAFYSQWLVFCTVFVAYSLLESWPGVVSSVMAVAAAFVWWLGVVRDHQKDDVKYLQGHIVVICKDVQKLEGVCTQLQGLPEASSALGKSTTLCSAKLQNLRVQLQQREQRICKRFCMLPVVV